MTRSEWESLCDGCGRCCLLKIDEEDTGKRHTTRLACKLLDIGACRCSNYTERHQHVPDCVVLTSDNILELDWMPKTCAYRRLAEGKDLAWWHPLVSGRPETVHEAGVSVRSFAKSEAKVAEENVWRYIIPDLSNGPTSKSASRSASKPDQRATKRTAKTT